MTRTRLQAKVAGEIKSARGFPPPTGFPESARPLWDEIVASVGPRHFKRADATMLAQYVILTSISSALWATMLKYPDSDGIKDFTTVVRTLNQLAVKLRVVPSSRDIRQRDNAIDQAQAQSTGDGFFGEG